MAVSSLMVPLGTPAHDFELRLSLREPATRLLPSAAEDRAAPLRVVPSPARPSS